MQAHTMLYLESLGPAMMKASPTYDIRDGDVVMFSGLTFSGARSILARVRRYRPHARLVKMSCGLDWTRLSRLGGDEWSPFEVDEEAK